MKRDYPELRDVGFSDAPVTGTYFSSLGSGETVLKRSQDMDSGTDVLTIHVDAQGVAFWWAVRYASDHIDMTDAFLEDALSGMSNYDLMLKHAPRAEHDPRAAYLPL
jgi:hypothetical protein